MCPQTVLITLLWTLSGNQHPLTGMIMHEFNKTDLRYFHCKTYEGWFRIDCRIVNLMCVIAFKIECNYLQRLSLASKL